MGWGETYFRELECTGDEEKETKDFMKEDEVLLEDIREKEYNFLNV